MVSEQKVAELQALILILAERLYIVASHLSVLAERKEMRRVS